MITVGLDFGTHQTKVCIENKKGSVLEYQFMKFLDDKGNPQYTLPSTIYVDRYNKLHYGYGKPNDFVKTIRYFKQSVFCPENNLSLNSEDALYYSIWYLAYILFDLEELYGQGFAVQMGAPTDSSHFRQVQEKATVILTSAYRLVEDVFENNKAAFLNSSIITLKTKTVIRPYSSRIKEEYQMLVFPEAYACLKPLVAQKALTNGMNMIVDIGGGTTDISFFNTEKHTGKTLQPVVYRYHSIPYGINFLSGVTSSDSNKKQNSKIKLDPVKVTEFLVAIRKLVLKFIEDLRREHKIQTKLDIERLMSALDNRPLIYSGGGSTFEMLLFKYEYFSELRVVSQEQWNVGAVKDIQDIIKKNLCPILSTAYGLSISEKNDLIKEKTLSGFFDKVKGLKEIPSTRRLISHTDHHKYNEDFDYGLDWDAMK